MRFNTFELKQPPFQKVETLDTTSKKRVSMRTDISPEDYETFFEGYFIRRYGTPDKARSKFVKDLLIDFLNTHAFDKKSFKNMRVILLLPKTFDINELQWKTEIIGFLNDENTLKVPRSMFRGGANYTNKYKFIYTVKEFNKMNYNRLGLQKLDEAIFFDVSKYIQHDFDKVKSRLGELYPDIDVDDTYFVICNLNNYLDVLDEGVYVSKSSSHGHDGVLVLLKDFDEMAYLTVDWSIVQGHLSVFFLFETASEFRNKTINDTHEEIIEEFQSISVMISREQGLIDKKKHAQDMMKHYTKMIKLYDKELDKLKKIE